MHSHSARKKLHTVNTSGLRLIKLLVIFVLFFAIGLGIGRIFTYSIQNKKTVEQNNQLKIEKEIMNQLVQKVKNKEI